MTRDDVTRAVEKRARRVIERVQASYDEVQRGNVFADVREERWAQVARWGVQHHPDGTGDVRWRSRRDEARKWTDNAAKIGAVTWQDILYEEVAEAFAEHDPAALRRELVQVAAVAVAWIEDIDSQGDGTENADE